MMSERHIDITPSPRLLQVLGDIPLAPWQCVAEFVDNSLDELARGGEGFRDTPLRVDITVEPKPGGGRVLVIRDNGLGMGESELGVALRAGATSKARYGTLGLFGMGFNIATARLGSVTVVTTSRKGDQEALSATIDFQELQRTEKFTAPLKTVPKKNSADSGTEIRVTLKREMAEYFGAAANLTTLRQQLGNIYSFMLRDSVPGISKPGLSSAVQAEIMVASERVTAKLPCIWAEDRSVQSYGVTVNAVQYVDTQLTEAVACLTCGYWDRQNGPTECEECGSTRLESRSRRVWGWLGIQRFIDSSRYGVDFLRFGRKIRTQDKSVFHYIDPDTLQEDVEYPIEMPANRGRIVGEIHLDHVPVTYQKNDFDRQHRDWQKAMEIIRGDRPLKPKAGGVSNDSPLARLFSAYRRNDPGLRYLTPGDGERAIHARATEWAGYFDKGVPRFQTDTEWYDAAKNHQEAADNPGTGGSAAASATATSGPSATAGLSAAGAAGTTGGQSAVSRLIGSGSAQQSVTASSTPASSAAAASSAAQPQPETRDDALARARTFASERVDLTGEFLLAEDLGTWRLAVFETNQLLKSPDGDEVPCTVGNIAGSQLEIFVNREHPVITEFGRDIRDLALFQAADVIRSLQNASLPTPAIYAMLVGTLSDLRVTAVALQEQANSALARVKQLVFDVIQEDPARWWGQLTNGEKTAIEDRAAVQYSTTPFPEIVNDGRFATLLDGRGIARLVEYAPLQFFDNRVFRAALEQRPEPSRKRPIRKVVDLLIGLSDFADDTLARQPDDLALARVRLEGLNRQLRSDAQL
jgi:hypothetical protein